MPYKTWENKVDIQETVASIPKEQEVIIVPLEYL